MGIVFGFASICTKGGRPYVDLQGEHIPEAVMLDFAAEFAAGARVAKSMHAGEPVGEVVFLYPLTAEVAKALDITTDTTGLLVGMRPNEATLAKFRDGTFTGFSIGGTAAYNEQEVEDGEA